MVTVYDSLLDVPLDSPGEDGDDSLVPNGEGSYFEPVQPDTQLLMSLPLTAGSLAVPYFHLKKGSKGKPVVALNRSLSRAGYRKWQDFSRVWNPWVTKAVKKFQSDHNLKVTGVYDKETHRLLARYYDAYSIKYLLKASIPPVDKNAAKRQEFLAELMYIYNIRWNVYYTQRRPFDVYKPPRGLDCSASGEWACKWAEIPSPSGYSGYGWGNTWSQMGRLSRLGRKTSVQKGKIGDFVFYGRGGPTHVAYYIGGNRVWSFGSYPAKILNVYYRSDYLGIYSLFGES